MKELTGFKKEKLIDDVLEQIQNDIIGGDVTALAELLSFLPTKNLVAYLPDDRMDRWSEIVRNTVKK